MKISYTENWSKLFLIYKNNGSISQHDFNLHNLAVFPTP